MSYGGISGKGVGAGGAGGAIDHNNRNKIRKDRRGEIDYRGAYMNEILYKRNDPKGILERAVERTEKYNGRKIVRRGKNARKVLVTFVAHASGDYFFDIDKDYWDKLDPGKSPDRDIIRKIYKERLNKERLKVWKERVLSFAKEEFGSNLLQVNLHTDEKTPHIHIDVMTWKEGRLNKNGLFPKKEYLKMRERYNQKVNVPEKLKNKGPNPRKRGVDFRYYKVLKRAGIEMEDYNRAIRTLKDKDNTPEDTYKVLGINKEDVKPVTKKKDIICRLEEYYKTNLVGIVKKMQDVYERYESQNKSPEVHIDNGKER